MLRDLTASSKSSNIDVLGIQETHYIEEVNEKVISIRNRKHHSINLGCQNSFHGLGFITRSGLVVQQHNRPI